MEQTTKPLDALRDEIGATLLNAFSALDAKWADMSVQERVLLAAHLDVFAANLISRVGAHYGSPLLPSVERTMPESQKTLLLQQIALITGRKMAQMFPIGTAELPLPERMKRVVTDRGVFHYNPDLIDAPEIVSCSRAGKENKVLGLGQYSKSDVLESGLQQVCVIERTSDGTEVLSALSTADWAASVILSMSDRLPHGHTIGIEPVDRVISQRISSAWTH